MIIDGHETEIEDSDVQQLSGLLLQTLEELNILASDWELAAPQKRMLRKVVNSSLDFLADIETGLKE